MQGHWWLILLVGSVLVLFLLLAQGGAGPLAKRRSRGPARKKSTWGAVYVNQFTDYPLNFKVGFTQGLAKKRQYGLRSKVKAHVGEAPRLRQVFAIDMHHARKVEKRVLDALDHYRAPIGSMGEFLRFPAGADPSSVIDHIGTIVQAAAREVRDEMAAKGRWDDQMERAARIIRLTPDGRLVRQPLFVRTN